MHVSSSHPNPQIDGPPQAIPQAPHRPIPRARRLRSCTFTTLVAFLVCAPLIFAAQTATPARPAPSAPQLDPRALAEQCAAKEAQLITHENSYLRYRMHVIDEKGDQLRDQIETPQGSVARLLERDGRALTPEEDAAEKGRLNYLLNNPAAFEHHIKNEQANKKMGIDLLKLMPEAMLWSYAPGQPSLPEPFAAPAAPVGALIVLDFTPNPKWNPPTIPADALTGLAGRIWIDAQTQQMVYIEGSLIKPVNIGWGMVAHLYPGGKISIHQTPINSARWMVDHIVEQLNVRALMLKTIRQRLQYDTSTYQPVPSMTYLQAIKLLLETPLPSR